jgi:hypothetical protein
VCLENCLIKTFIRKTQWDKNLIERKKSTMHICPKITNILHLICSPWWDAPPDKNSFKTIFWIAKLGYTDVYFMKWNNIINDWMEYKQRLALWSNTHMESFQNLFNIFWLMDKHSIWSMLALQVETIFPFPCLSFLNSFTKNSRAFQEFQLNSYHQHMLWI